MREVLFRKPATRLRGRLMDFELTEEHRLLEQSVREWAGREVAPRIRELDRAHRFDRGLLPQMASLGLLGISVPVEHGGSGMDYVALGLACEELEYVDTSLRVILSVHVGLNSLTLLSWGTDDQKARYLVPQAQGERIATFGAHRAVGRQRRARHPDRGGQEGRPLRADRREDVDLAGRRRRPRAGVRLDRSGQEEGARPVRHERVHRRARLRRVLERHAHREVGHPRRQHRLPQARRRGSAGRESGRARRRRLQDRDVRARPGPLHRGGRRDRPDSRLPRRQRDLREAAQDVRRRDRLASAGQGNDRAAWSRTTRRRACSGCDPGG